jgi:cytochrome c oxidase subunit I+III
MSVLPNFLPRPAHELEELRRIWAMPAGLRRLTEYNNNFIGALYVATAFVFFLLAGVLALLMRAQLAVPGNDLVGPSLYNQLFTMHGTVMMFLFAVPAVEAMGILLLPNMLGARDMPFPRLSAYAYWAYAVGGLVFFASLFFGAAPGSCTRRSPAGPIRPGSTRTSGCSASASSRSRRSPAPSRSSSACCARARPA